MVSGLMADPDRQIRLLGAYGLFTYPFACIPFLYFYFQDHRIDRGQFLWLIAWYYWAMVLMEIPTGMLADRFGRRRCLIAGSTVLATAFFTIYFGRQFVTFCAAEVLFGIGHALLSGTPTALLYDHLKRREATGQFLLLESRVHALRLLGTGGSFLAGGVIAWLSDIPTAVLCTALLCLTGALIAALLRDEVHPGTAVRPLLRAALSDLRSAPMLWIIGYFVLLFGLLRFAFHTYQPYFEDTVFDEARTAWNWLVLGALFAALNLVAAPCSRLAPRLVASLPRGAVFTGMAAALGAAFLAMAATPNWFGVALFFVHQVPFGLHWSIVQDFVNHRVATANRATALSVVSFAGRASFAAWFPLVGAYERGYGMAATYGLVGVIGLGATAVWCAPGLGGRLLRRSP